MIHVLEKKVADKIAAGEVIDRPVSIIKELLENSIDAGADNITVEIKNGGKSYIRVTDNGCGISPEDIETAFKRHATSKISSVKDLDSIITLGFRGEALASICAVSRVELISKTSENKIGRRIVTEGSEIIVNEGCGCPDGTTVSVRDLFYNVPARKKFLSSDNGESRRIIDMVSRIALSYPDIRITLINGRSKVFSTQGRGNIFNSRVSIYGNDTGRDLLPVESRRGEYLLKGYISAPSASSSSRSRQIFCVNGRVVSSKVIERAVDDAYHDKLFHGRYPAAFLFLSMPPSKLDVNIHPTKKEVRFDDDFEVRDFISSSVRNALDSMEALPQIRAEDIKPAVPKASQTVEKEPGTSEENTFKPQNVKKEPEEQIDIKDMLHSLRQKSVSQHETVLKEDKVTELKNEDRAEIPEVKTPEFSARIPDFTGLECFGSIFNTYILASDGTDFYLIDQHAAHERIFYEKLLNQYTSSQKAMQRLLVPINVSVPAHIPETESDWIGCLRNMGYDIEYFGNKTYIVREIPAFMELAEAEDFLKDVFMQLEEKPDLTDRKSLDRIIMRSCKSAVKGGDHLTFEEIKALLKDLNGCENPFSCPHGRPTFVRMTKYEIEKMFKRV